MKYQLTVELTTKENAPLGWGAGDKTKDQMIAENPIHYYIPNWTGGYCKDFEELHARINELVRHYRNHKFTPELVPAYGTWELAVSDSLPTQTFYSVKYRNWGADGPSTAWFDNKQAADRFYNSRDHVDPPKAHRARSAETISKYEALCDSPF